MFGVGRLKNPLALTKAAPTPPVTSGLYTWLDAQDASTMTFVSGNINTWADKSGNGFDWTAPATHRPAYDATLFGGKGGVVFDFATGGGMLSNNPTTIARNNFTMFMIGTRRDAKVSALVQDFASGIVFGPSGFNNRYGCESFYTLEGVPEQTLAIEVFKNTGNSATSAYYDSMATKKTWVKTVNLPTGATTLGNLSYGGKDFGPNCGWTSYGAGLLIYNRALSDSEIAQVCTWLRKFYKVPAAPALNNIVLFSGDSIATGFASDASNGTAYADLAMVSLGFSANQWFATAGQGAKIADAGTVDTSLADPIYQSGKINIISAQAGVNDLIAGNSLATMQTDIQAYCAARRAVGWKIIVTTIMPSSAIGTDANRTAYNSWLVANWNTFADGLADVASDATMGNPANTSNTTYFADGTHPTATGHALIAPYFATAISGLL